MHNATEIIPGLWVGNQTAAKDPLFFEKFHIQAVINCTKELPNSFSQTVLYFRVPIDDSGKTEDINKMTQYLPLAIQFLKHQHIIANKHVLIHCHAGIQRSATVAAAYLHSCFNKSIPEAIHQIVRHRPIAFFGGTHFNFKESLKAFGLRLQKKINA